MTRLGFLLLLLLGFPAPVPGSDADPMSSIFLVARKELPDPFFRDSVVLVTHRAGPVPVGVIINRPTQLTVARVIPDLDQSPARETKVFFGGPVSAQALMVVFRAEAPPKDAIEVLEGVYLSSSAEVLRELLGRKVPAQGVRLFAGHASWAPGQLEAEIARRDWHLVRADARTLFESKPEDLWRELERRASAKMARRSSP